MTLRFWFFSHLSHLSSLGFVIRLYLGKAAATSYPAKFKANKEDYLLFFSVVSELALIESSVHLWIRSEELICLGLVTWGSTQTTWAKSGPKKGGKKKKIRQLSEEMGSNVREGGHQLKSSPSLTFTPNPSPSLPVLEISHKELSAQHLNQNFLECLLTCRFWGSIPHDGNSIILE